MTAISSARVASFLAQFEESQSRAVAVDTALRQVATAVRDHLALFCELVALAHDESTWSKVQDGSGRPYESEERFFDSLGVGSWRSYMRYLSVGRMIRAIPDERARASTRACVAQIGVTKAAILVPAIERAAKDAATRDLWFERAKQSSTEELQQHVNDAVRGAPRGYETAKGERFRAYLVNAAPSIEDREVLERLFALGARLAETPNPVAIFFAAAREALAAWEAELGDLARAKQPGRES